MVLPWIYLLVLSVDMSIRVCGAFFLLLLPILLLLLPLLLLLLLPTLLLLFLPLLPLYLRVEFVVVSTVLDDSRLSVRTLRDGSANSHAKDGLSESRRNLGGILRNFGTF